MQSNKQVKGLAIFSKDEQIRKRSLRLYTYLVCHSYLRNYPNAFGDNVRIFQQRDINLQQIKRTLGFDPDTIKRYWEGLEEEGLVKYCPHDFIEKKYYDKNYEKPISFKERWKERNKHKEVYYEIPISKNQLFRKIPKETLISLNEEYQINELTMKVYMTLVNYQEFSILNGQTSKKFTYLDLRELLGYSQNIVNNRKLEVALNLLDSLNLVKFEKGEFINTYGAKIPCFVLKQTNFYISYDIKDFDTGEENAISEEDKKKIIEINKQNYPEAFK